MGLTALQLAVPAVDPILDALRPQLPAGATVLDPAHISFGYPWLPPDAARAIADDIADIVASQPSFEVELFGPRRFDPDARGRVTVWLEPHPRAQIDALQDTIAAVSGHHPTAFTPHCSVFRVRHAIDAGPLEAVARVFVPIRVRLDVVELHVQQRGGWRRERRMPLGRPSA